MSDVLADSAARDAIRRATDRTLFVNAGAGSGKTSALVERVSTLVLTDGVRLANIAAVTFTDKAGAELRDRLRERFEQARRDPALRPLADEALDDLDSAAIGTLHSFAQRILSEHPIEAGLPPIIEVLDEVGSSVAFEERWAEVQSRLLDDDTVARPLLIAMALGTKFDHLRSLTQLLGKDWDLIDEHVLAAPPPGVSVPDLGGFAARAAELVGRAEHCVDPGDLLLPRLNDLAALLSALREAPDDESRLGVLLAVRDLKFTNGRKGNWRCPIDDVRADGTALADEARRILQDVLDRCLRNLTSWLAQRVVESAQLRRREGTLEFHDLLVLARDLLCRHPPVRAALHDGYRRLLLDEFQDTDPIQIELAARICGGAGADAPDWQDVALPPGRLFVVGDSKQSIYRFRRASIRTYLEAERTIGEPTGLTTNFRTVEPILDWVNSVFGRLITYEDGQQPAYVPLDPHRPGRDETAGPPVTVLGADPHPDAPTAAQLRTREAADVAAVIRQALDEGWLVEDQRTGRWRPVAAHDIAVLVPARTSLPFLQEALEVAGIPYRAETSSLVYHTAEVRSLLACARAIADTSDELSLLTALRSPLFGCGDDDLWRWRQGGGRFSIYTELPGELGQGPVGSALIWLRSLYRRSRWLAPSEVLAAIIADRRMLEVAATGRSARDGWRQLRFVVDQARAWSEVSHGGLRAYLAWAARQGQENSRVAEAVLPESDALAVRVMTVHAAKGLEFPVVVLSGMTAQRNNRRGVSLIWTAHGYDVRLRKGVETDDFEAAVPIDEQMDAAEKLRLLYVAATRARDHLVVSLHRADGSRAETAARLLAEVGAVDAPGAVRFTGWDAVPPDAAERSPEPPPEFTEWLAGVQQARARSAVVPTISASGLEGTEPDVVLAAAAAATVTAAEGEFLAGRAKGPRDLDLPPWSKGRYGSAVGRAVHAVLQVVDLATGAGLDQAVAAQSVAEGVLGHEETVRALARSALASDVVRRAAARRHWRETYVGTTRADGTVVEGYIDLVYRDDDGTLVIVDYKTDAIPAGAVGSRVEYYRPQMQAYREALGAATGAATSATLLFLNPSTTVAVACE